MQGKSSQHYNAINIKGDNKTTFIGEEVKREYEIELALFASIDLVEYDDR